jgi:membrane fusion protein (multidrug efflux system)
MRPAALLLIASLGCGHHLDDHDLVDVQREDLVLTVEVAGDLAAVDSTDIKPPPIPETSQFKIGWLAPEGSEVAAGEPVVKFEPTELDHGIEQLQSQLAEARLRLAQGRAAAALARRQEELGLLEQEASARKSTLSAELPPDLVARVTLRGNQLDAEEATADLAQARNNAAHSRRSSDADIQGQVDMCASLARQIEQYKRSLTRLSVAAPRAGTVVYATTNGTEKSKVGDQVYLSNAVALVVALGAMAGNGWVDEVDVARVAPHEPVTLQIDALPDVTLHGKVASIAASVQRSDIDPSNIVRLQITVDPTGAALRPGMRFRGRIETQRIPSVVQVPAEAVFVTPEGPVAYREAAGELARVHLELGRRSSNTIEVKSGLSAGDRVSRKDPAQGEP